MEIKKNKIEFIGSMPSGEDVIKTLVKLLDIQESQKYGVEIHRIVKII